MAEGSSVNCVRPEDYPFGDWEEHLESAIKLLAGRPRHCGINAFRCLRRAWKIADADPEMAWFRAITAQEEAATALIFALKQQRYPDSDQLNHCWHPHKAGLYPFIQIIEAMFREAGFPSARYRLQYSGKRPRLDIEIATELLGLPPGGYGRPDEPLNILISRGNQDGLRVSKFKEEMRRTAEAWKQTDIASAVRKIANLRNQLLYATDRGIPVAADVDSILIGYRKSVSVLLTITIAILQTSELQFLAVQALAAYMVVIGKMPSDQFDYGEVLELEPNLHVTLDKERGPTAVLRMPFTVEASRISKP